MLTLVHQPTWFASLDLSSPAAEITALLAALVPLFERRFAQVSSELGLTRAQAQFLVQLPADEALSQRDMSQRLHCAPSSVVGLIDGLEERGWLSRRVDSTDRRINVLVLTPAGKQAREELLGGLLTPAETIRRLPMTTQLEVRGVMRALVAELGQHTTEHCD
jgi:MarR family transcriptional regulator, organic hydroperoxide resistance regulator